MPTRNISLTPEQDAFVEEVVRLATTRMPARLFGMRCVYLSSAGRKTASV